MKWKKLFSEEAANKKVMVGILVVGIFLMLTWCAILYFNEARVTRLDISQIKMDDGSLKYSIDDLKMENTKIYIRGWIIYPGEDLGFFQNHVVLKNVETNAYFSINTDYEIRTDVTASIQDNQNYDNCGFHSWVKKSTFNKGRYLVCLLYQSNGKNILCETNRTIQIS